MSIVNFSISTSPVPFIFTLGVLTQLGACGGSVSGTNSGTGGASATTDGGTGATAGSAGIGGSTDSGSTDSGSTDSGGADSGTALECQFERIFSGTKDETSPIVAATVDGGMVVTGAFAGGLELMGNSFYAPTHGTFVVRLSEVGQPIWASAFGEVGAVVPQDLAIAPNGDVWITGMLQGAVDLGFGAVSGPSSIFLLRLASDGTPVAAQTFGPVDVGDLDGSANARGAAVAVASTGEVYFSAQYEQSINIGGFQLDAPSTGCPGVFVAKVDTDGSVLWATPYPGRGGSLDANDAGFLLVGKATCALTANTAIVVGDPDGKVLVSASPGGTAWAGAFGLVGTFASVSQSGASSTCRMHDASGETIWEHTFSREVGASEGAVAAMGVSVSPSGEVAVTGGFKGTLHIDGDPVTTSQDVDVFVARFDAQGTLTYVDTFGGTALDEGRSVAFDTNGNLLISARSESDLEVSAGLHTHQGADALVMRRCP